jgi:hypothetical protein
MTLSQSISVAVFVAAVLLGLFIIIRPGARMPNGVPEAAKMS